MSPTKNLKKALKKTKSALGKKAESLTNEVIESAAYKIAETAEPRLEQNVYWRVLRAKQIDTRKLHFVKSFELGLGIPNPSWEPRTRDAP